ncbi:hypothetical protein BD324DRAFT_651723 [Kockovaella imperatae]|uniref:GAR domain-containing protein n=1 Tax=Kockovaella imperatae TaxID=4999 RepID=A0A1Y1UHC7_9TREE|nr:hypothetical protein BD324DRAFT_651723 [Kockovaella imperatae]ORX36485.1 hypothetical protein BD324DRAFT_651723 [Kockovaella imperatae]
MTDLDARLSELSLADDVGPRQQNGENSTSIEDLRDSINLLLDGIYEIQELRHAASKLSSDGSPHSQLVARVAEFDRSFRSLQSRITATEGSKRTDDPEVEEIHSDWSDLEREYVILQQEMREDGWLSRFRITADQAESMMTPLQTSLKDCLHYVESITSSPVPVPFESELEELPSLRKLQDLVKSHEAMKATYIPSVAKILKMMERSIFGRTSKNGEALRRYSEMTQRWNELQRQLQQLDARVRILMTQHLSRSSSGDFEVLAEATSPSGSSSMDYFARGHAQKLSVSDIRKSIQHRTSVSSVVSGVSGTSAASMQRRALGANGIRAATESPEVKRTAPPLRSRASMMSGMSSTTARMSTGTTPPVPTRQQPVETMLKTPTNQRFAGAGRRSGAFSPSPTASSTSRIPMSSPGGPSPRHLEVPGSASRESRILPDPSNWPKPVYGQYSSRRPGPPSVGGRSVSGSIARGPPPSSFRSTTPTPAGRSVSRMSMGSQAPSMYAPPSLQPFQPSKYDLLDQTVQSVIDETKFKLFVARVDPSMKRGQRRAENEEWKGGFVFGAGQKVSPVKLLKIAGRPGRFGFGQGQPRMKCLVKVAGAWQELSTLLKERLENAPQGFDSP